jgi:flagellar motor switch protein FliN/FliY
MKMTSDMLSQDEIDALLKQGGDDEDESNDSMDPNDILSELEKDALGEIGNITFGSASTALSTLLGLKVDITTPKISMLEKENIEKEFPVPHVSVHVNYTEGFQGINLLVIKTDDAKIIADLMMGGDGTLPNEELSELHVSAVQEAMNQMMGSAATSMSTIFSRKVDISPPGIDILDMGSSNSLGILEDAEMFVKVSFRMKVGTLIDSNIMQLITIPFAKQMVELLLNPSDGASDESNSVDEKTVNKPAPAVQEHVAPKSTPVPDELLTQPHQNHQMNQQPMYQQNHQMNQQPMYQQNHQVNQQPMTQQNQHMYQSNGSNPGQLDQNRAANVQPVQFSNFDQNQGSQSDMSNLDLLLDIPLNVTVELGRTKRVIKEILELSPGSILELDKLAGEPVDILVNNKLIAKGEVVVIEENFGVRVTDILNQWDRLQKLQ